MVNFATVCTQHNATTPTTSLRPLLPHHLHLHLQICGNRLTISWCCEALLIIAVQLSGSAIICMSSAVMEICFVTAMDIERDV